MEINKLNYEVYFMDYYDGNLTAEQTAELMLFLEQHADLKIEFEEFEELQLEAPNIKINKENFIKTITPVGLINESNYDDYFIEQVEGISPDTDRIQSFLKVNTFLQRDYQLYQKTVLKPDYAITYSDKKALKKTAIIPLFTRRILSYGSIAAAIIWGVITFNQPQKTYKLRDQFALNKVEIPNYTPLAEVTPLTNKQVHANHKNTAIKTVSVENSLLTKKKENTSSDNEQQGDLEKQQLAENFVEPTTTEDIISSPDETISKEDPTLKVIRGPKKEMQENNSMTPKAFFAKVFRKKILKENESTPSQTENLKGFELAQGGIKVVNKLLGTKVKLNSRKNEDGEMVAYALNTGRFEYEKSARKGK